jgi:integrase
LIVVRRKKKHLAPTEMQVSGAIMSIIKAWAAKQPEGFIFPGRCKPCEIQRMKKGEDGKMVKAALEPFCVGGHASLRDIQRRWQLCTVATGLKVYGRGIHTLRHYAITEFYKRTKDLRAAQVFAAHSSSSMTERYSHVTNLKEYVDAMEVVL